VPSLREEIKQTRPFQSLLEEALLNIVRTSGVLSYAAAEALKPHGLTGAQYNVLRILRGAGPAGIPCSAIGERMLTRDSDVTRLLDRLAAMKLIERARGEDDRRVVTTRLSEEGKALLATLDPVVRDVQQRLLGHIEERALRELIGLLERAREKAGS
jgi:DNA-binding MarR family transcriptional regulator